MALTIKKTAFVLLATTAVLITLPHAYAVEKHVVFSKGQTSAVYNGKIKGREYDRYYFNAKQGQVLNLDLESAAHAEMVLFDQHDYIQGEPYVLPKSGRYEVRVLQMRTFARQGAKSPYTLTISIDNPSLSDSDQAIQTDSMAFKQQYSCDNGKVLEVLYINAPNLNYAVVNQMGEMIPMDIMPMASGANYAAIDKNYDYKLYTKGNHASLEQGGKLILDNCIEK